MVNTLRGFLRDDGGASAVEYGLIASLIAMAMLGVLVSFGGELSDHFFYVANRVEQ